MSRRLIYICELPRETQAKIINYFEKQKEYLDITLEMDDENPKDYRFMKEKIWNVVSAEDYMIPHWLMKKYVGEKVWY